MENFVPFSRRDFEISRASSSLVRTWVCPAAPTVTSPSLTVGTSRAADSIRLYWYLTVARSCSSVPRAMLPAVQDSYGVGEVLSFFQVVSRQDQKAVSRETSKKLPKVSTRDRVQARRGLVEEDDVRVRGKDCGHKDLALRPPGKAPVEDINLTLKTYLG